MILFTWLAASPAGGWDESRQMRERREAMVRDQIERRGVEDPAVLKAMRRVPRHLFVPPEQVNSAYGDYPLPIGEGQTISQPYIVALMSEILGLRPGDSVLEVGTGSGYQAAILAEMAANVYTIEIKEALHRRSTETLRELGYGKVRTRGADGYHGWEEAAPFDAIMITAAVSHIPPPLLRQLKDGGRMALPLGNPFSYQNLVLVTKKDGDYQVRSITGVLFVPMTGEALKK